MGLLNLFLRNSEFDLLYNCSFYSVDLIPLEQRQDRVFSVAVAILGITFEIMYIPCIYALSRRQVLQASFCYKLMLMMSIYDSASLAITCLLPSYFSFYGYMYCSAPRTMYVMGSVLHGLWFGYSQISLILALNRCMSFSRYKWIFDGSWQLIWIAVPSTFTLTIIMFGTTTAYNSQLKGWFFNPHRSYYEDVGGKYISYINLYNNIIFILLLPTIYFVFYVNHFLLARKRSKGMPRKVMGLFLQIFFINATITIATIAYTIMQYIELPRQTVAITHIAWILTESAPPLIYLTANQTVRQIVFAKKHNQNSFSNNCYKWTEKSNLTKSSQESGKEMFL